MKKFHSTSRDRFDPDPPGASGRMGSSGSRDTARVGGELIEGKTPTRDRPPKFYRIGEVVDYSGVSRQTIHNYTTMGLINETDWTRGGHRLYDENVFERLDTIAYFKSNRKSLGFIKKYFVQLDSGKEA